MEKRYAGPKAILIQGLMSGTLDISRNEWAQQVTITLILPYRFNLAVKIFIWIINYLGWSEWGEDGIIQ